ncbi:MAG: MFS transporter [Chloroflexi bacterium]|nr:MFS transporter [Chloroflexota bacterium]
MLSFFTKSSQPRRTLLFGSTMHIWNDLYFAILVTLLPFIEKDMDLSFTQVGLLRSVFAGASGILQIPVGFLAESVGEFWLLILGNLWVPIGLVAMALSPVFVVLLATSFLGGLGGGAQHPLGSSMVSRAYDDRGRSTAVGTVNFAGDLGKMIAPLIAAATVVTFGWRATLFVVGFAGIAFTALASLTRRSVDIGRPTKTTSDEEASTDDKAKMGGFIALSGVGILDASVRTAAMTFLPFVLIAKDMSTAQAVSMLFFLFLGGAFGKFVVGWLGERFGTVSLIWGTKGMTAVLLVASIYAPPAATIPLMIAIGIGLNGTSSILYATVAEFIPARRRARFYGFYYTTNEIGTVIAPIAYGVIADALSLNATMIIMGVVTLTILPASLTLRKYVGKRTVAAG